MPRSPRAASGGRSSTDDRPARAAPLTPLVPLTPPRLRWGLCCQFAAAPIRFRTATHRYVSQLDREARRQYLADVAHHNAGALRAAVEWCHERAIGAFRVSSQILPLATHPLSGYTLADLDAEREIERRFAEVGARARALGVRLSFHPDQFVVLNSEHAPVVAAAIRELEMQGALAALIGADTLTLHGGGAAGGRVAALGRLERAIERLGDGARTRLALENDDRLYSVLDLLPLCERAGVPLVYDVHHHRCHPDGLTVPEATDRAAATWGEREPFVHLASPRDGWGSANPRPHADYVNPADFPVDWLERRMTIDVEAKQKEFAVAAIRTAVAAPHRARQGPPPPAPARPR